MHMHSSGYDSVSFVLFPKKEFITHETETENSHI